MGCWGFGPFDRDDILDDFGGYHSKQEIFGAIKSLIYSNDSYKGIYAASILLVRSLGFDTGNIVNENTFSYAVNAVNTDIISKSVSEYFYETSWLLLSVGTLELKDREKLLLEALNFYKRNNNFKIELINNLKVSSKNGLIYMNLNNKLTQIRYENDIVNLLYTLVKSKFKLKVFETCRCLTVNSDKLSRAFIKIKSNSFNEDTKESKLCNTNNKSSITSDTCKKNIKSCGECYECVGRIKNNNVIIGYDIKIKGNIVTKTSDEVKKALRADPNCISNLRLTSDDRIYLKK